MRAQAAAEDETMTNGFGAAAVLAAGVGSLALALLAIATDRIHTLQSAMILSRPTGPLSGVTTWAVAIWLATWAVLSWRWRNKTVAAGRMAAAAMVLLILALLLTFPPVGDLF